MPGDQLHEQRGGLFGIVGLLRLVDLPFKRGRGAAAIVRALLPQGQHELGGLGWVESQA